MHYGVEEATTEELAAADPFSGAGVFLALPGATAPEILKALESAFGAVVPAVACPGKGAWVDSGQVGGTKDHVVVTWERAHA